VVAFVTFTTQEASERCISNFISGLNMLYYPTFKEKAFKLFGEKVQLLRAAEA